MSDLCLVRITEVQNCITESVADLLKQFDVEVVVSKLALIGPAKASLKRKSICDA